MLLKIVLFLFLLTGPAMAQSPEWGITPGGDHTRITFQGTQMGAPFDGHFDGVTGSITFDPANLAASKADIMVDIASLDAGSPDRNKYLPAPDWFNIDAFPQARFVTTTIEKGLDTNQYVAKGNLTIRDVTLPVTLPFVLTITGDSAVMDGSTTINRLDFGVGQGQWKDIKTVGAEVKISVKLTATRKI